ncbi:leucine-rich repeat-containing protein 15 [Cylas formicarius]|uniref:leucine-rich repeat-containing protein 15 n=1 Tax=Cylas formicarius TaxID=197179 RepID=UPI0029586060|nr:leucine-rich repeat-containing protein 15 [Cylas formicarius]
MVKMWYCGLVLLPLTLGYSVSVGSCPEICLCDGDNSEITSCQDNGLLELPIDIDSNVISLDLSRNAFDSFPGDLKNFSKLKYLNMSRNCISTLMLSDFVDLVNLERLDFSSNCFRDWKDIHPSTFLPIKNLQYLDLSNNPLRSLPRYSNQLYIESLAILRLVNCSMKTIPVNVFNRLAGLRELHLAYNPLTSINESFQLDNLKYVDLSKTRLNYIDENVFTNLINLETLVLKDNVHLKRFMCHSESLLYLDLSGCTLEKVPSSNLPKLATIDLSFNFVKFIQANNFARSPNLVLLNLSTNALTSLSDKAFQALTQVQTIDLSYNKLTTVSDKLFSNASSLLRLNLSFNYIKSLDTVTSSSLKLLDVSYCEIYDLNQFSLVALPNLISLILSRNFLSTIPDGFYSPSLVYLDVSSCRIKSINNRTFQEMYNLRQINLANNGLTSLDPTYFPRAYAVNIKDNPWRCDCPNLKRMYEWMASYSENKLKELICDSPEKVEGKTWQDACLKEWYSSERAKDTMWYYSIGIVVLMMVALFGVILTKKVKEIKEKRIREEQEARRVEEREALRRMEILQRELREEEDRNAPDPRELQRPPSYNEALLLPRLDASHPSLAGSVPSLLGSRQSLRGSNSDVTKKGRVRRKRRRRKSDSERRSSRATVDSDSSDQDQVPESLPARRPQLVQPPPLESDF